MYDSDYIMSCCTPINSVANNPEKIYLGGPLWDEFTSEYYNEKNYAFVLLFQQYKASAVYSFRNLSTKVHFRYPVEFVPGLSGKEKQVV